MGKYVGYVLLILVVLVILDMFKIVDIPYLEIPDFTSGKKDMMDSSKEVLDQMK